MAIITKNPNVIFIHIPKTAGSSITKWLQVNAKGKKIKGKHSNMNEHKIGDHFVFACVRNPYDWVYSGWSFMRKFNMAKRITLHEYIIDEHMLKMVNATSQHQYINLDRIDLILNYENINEDFKQIQEKFNCDRKLGRSNKSERKENWQDALNDDMKEKIYQTYKADFEIFKYSI